MLRADEAVSDIMRQVLKLDEGTAKGGGEREKFKYQLVNIVI